MDDIILENVLHLHQHENNWDGWNFGQKTGSRKLDRGKLEEALGKRLSTPGRLEGATVTKILKEAQYSSKVHTSNNTRPTDGKRQQLEKKKDNEQEEPGRMKVSKRKFWKELCDQLKHTWEQCYKLSIKQLGVPRERYAIDMKTKLKIMSEFLFSEGYMWLRNADIKEVSRFSME
ncbi:hypothetical protein JTB14_011429 [Gonioctena quinquepunctata]|nr:hypothetical protein JTB14_011429 [Gonioctena quinquepunctata]